MSNKGGIKFSQTCSGVKVKEKVTSQSGVLDAND